MPRWFKCSKLNRETICFSQTYRFNSFLQKESEAGEVEVQPVNRVVLTAVWVALILIMMGCKHRNKKQKCKLEATPHPAFRKDKSCRSFKVTFLSLVTHIQTVAACFVFVLGQHQHTEVVWTLTHAVGEETKCRYVEMFEQKAMKWINLTEERPNFIFISCATRSWTCKYGSIPPGWYHSSISHNSYWLVPNCWLIVCFKHVWLVKTVLVCVL